MSKKLLLIVFLCFFVFSTGVGGEDKKADVIEFLSWGGGFDPNLFQFTPDDHTQLERFNSDTLVTLHIPPLQRTTSCYSFCMLNFGINGLRFISDMQSVLFIFD